MCILFIAAGQHSGYPLLIAANRDEYHARPSAPMHRWPDHPGILAGRDREAGGTWFGVNAHGRIAAVTNHRAAGLRCGGHAISRGELTARFLRNADTTGDFAGYLRDHHRDFRPFNLVYGQLGQLYCFSSTDPHSRPLAAGFHSLSNGPPDDPWPKMSRGVALLKAEIAADSPIDGEALARMMKDETRAADELLPNTGLPPAREKQLSSIFITGEDYGTRTTTLLLATAGEFVLHEYNYAPGGVETSRQRHSLTVEAAG